MLNKTSSKLACLGFVIAGIAGIATADVVTTGFTGVTNNNPTDTQIGMDQLVLEISDSAAGQITFTLSNTGPEASAIAEIYFDGAVLDSIQAISNGTGVDYSAGGSPPRLPGGNNIGFDTDFLVTANPPAPHNGVGPNESVAIVFNHQGTFQDVVAGLGSGDLRVGVHVIGFDTGGSESFVNVPAPASTAAIGLGALTMLRRRRR